MGILFTALCDMCAWFSLPHTQPVISLFCCIVPHRLCVTPLSPLPAAQVLRIATELLSILKYLGSLRPPVVHRDIKPENVVLEGGQWGGRVYLIDFGGVQGTSAASESGWQWTGGVVSQAQAAVYIRQHSRQASCAGL